MTRNTNSRARTGVSWPAGRSSSGKTEENRPVYELIENDILLRLSGVGRAAWLERLDRYHRPSNRSHRASGIDETKGAAFYLF